MNHIFRSMFNSALGAWAACALSGGTYTCSGISSAETLAGSPLVVSVDSTYSNVVNPDWITALDLTGTDGTQLTTATGSEIAASNRGSNRGQTRMALS
jgi:hypothetical protein